jgi:hypothetical protein
LVGVSEIDLPQGEQEDREAGEAEAKEELEHGCVVEPLRFQGLSLFVREVKRGDYVIQVWRAGRGKRVYPHARVLATRSTRSARGADVFYVYLGSPIESATIAWSAFKRGMAKAGAHLGGDVGTREIKTRAAVEKARTLTRWITITLGACLLLEVSSMPLALACIELMADSCVALPMLALTQIS